MSKPTLLLKPGAGGEKKKQLNDAIYFHLSKENSKKKKKKITLQGTLMRWVFKLIKKNEKDEYLCT